MSIQKLLFSELLKKEHAMLNLPHLQRDVPESAQRKAERRLLLIGVFLFALTCFFLGLLLGNLFGGGQ